MIENKEIEKRGIHNARNLLKWEGKKEIFWIIFFLLLFFCAWAYQRDISVCREIASRDLAWWTQHLNLTVSKIEIQVPNLTLFNFTKTNG